MLVAAAAFCVSDPRLDPPFAYRTGRVPSRDIVARVAFAQEDPVATLAAGQRAKSEGRASSPEDPKPLEQLRATAAQHGGGVDGRDHADEGQPQHRVARVPTAAGACGTHPRPFPGRAAVSGVPGGFFRPGEPGPLRPALRHAFAPFEKRGLLDLASCGNGPAKATSRAWETRRRSASTRWGDQDRSKLVRWPTFRLATDRRCVMRSEVEPEDDRGGGSGVRLGAAAVEATLVQDEAATQEAQNAAVFAAVEPVMVDFQPGQVLAPARPTVGGQANRTT